jgi:hypothetical protein
MKAWKMLTVASAALALAAPAANATFDRSLPSKAPKAKVTKKVHHQRLMPKTTPRPLIIVAQGPTAIAEYGGDCASALVNCTNQQLCDLWAMSCDLAAADQAAAEQANAAATTESTTG